MEPEYTCSVQGTFSAKVLNSQNLQGNMGMKTMHMQEQW